MECGKNESWNVVISQRILLYLPMNFVSSIIFADILLIHIFEKLFHWYDANDMPFLDISHNLILEKVA